MPEPFGTHHSKMMILLRHDDLAQYERISPFYFLDCLGIYIFLELTVLF